jgi:hypothetical protein
MSKKQSSPSSQVQKESIKEISKKGENKLALKETKAILKFSIEDAKNISISSAMGRLTAEKALVELAEKQFPLMKNGDKAPDDVSKNIDNVSLVYSQESGHALVESIEPRYRGFALQLRNDMKKEFDCRSASEIALVDQIVNSHIRKISYSKLMESHNEPKWLSHEKIALLNFFSRETDRAHRQFISSLEALKFLKQPTLKVNIKTNNAFMGENQQFNNNQNNEAR